MTTQSTPSAAENLIAPGLFADAGVAAIAGAACTSATTALAALTIDASRAKETRPPGSVLSARLAGCSASSPADVMPSPSPASTSHIFAARHQNIASIIEAGMLDVGMVIFSLLGLGLARLGKPARAERVLVIVCSSASAGMSYAAADVASPRSVIVYVAPPLFLAVASTGSSPSSAATSSATTKPHRGGPSAPPSWLRPARRAVALYTLRLALDCRETARGLRQAVLNAAPLPAAPAVVPQVTFGGPRRPAARRPALLTLYRQDRRHGDRSPAARAAPTWPPNAGLHAGTARTYINEYLASLNGGGRAAS